MSELHGDLDALVTEVHRRVEQRALERSAMAERRVREVLEQADEEAADVVRQRARTAAVEAAELRERARARTRMDAERSRLRQREALLEKVWAQAQAALEDLADDRLRYSGALRELARLASAALASDEVTLASDARGRALLTPERLAAWGREDGVRYRLADPRTADLAPLGAGLEARAGRLVCDLTFATRLQAARGALREATMARLLAGADP